jgi:hypothetical protein
MYLLLLAGDFVYLRCAVGYKRRRIQHFPSLGGQLGVDKVHRKLKRRKESRLLFEQQHMQISAVFRGSF